MKPSSSPPAPPPPRKPRGDAQRNRARLLAVARATFERRSVEATMDEIAREAGVGPGTLYRHFPTRDALVEAVYRAEVEKLGDAGQQFAQTLPPLEALRTWMLLLIDHVAAKRLILPVMDTVPGGSTRLIRSAGDIIHGTFFTLARQAIAHGDLRPDTNPEDLLRALVGTFYTVHMPGWEDGARRVTDLVLRGAGTPGNGIATTRKDAAG